MNSKQIVYLSQSQYAELIANGTITVNGVTVTYDENDIYVTPQAEPVTDVRVNGTSVAANGVADIPRAQNGTFGVIKLNTAWGIGIDTGSQAIYTLKAPAADIKTGVGNYKSIVPTNQHQSVFYGLATASGDTTQSQSNNAVGTYTPEAKGAIQQMLGVSDLIGTSENNLTASKAYAIGDVFTANGKLYKATAAIAADAAIITDGANANCEETSIGEGFVKVTDYANDNTAGVIRTNPYYGTRMVNNNTLSVNETGDEYIKAANRPNGAITTTKAHLAAFYGLAKAAGDTTQSQSSNAVGTYTDTAKSAIRTMLGAASDNIIAISDTAPTDPDTKIWIPETATSSVQVPTVSEMESALAGKVGDVQVNSVSVVSNGIASIPNANNNNFGVVKGNPADGIGIYNSGALYISGPSSVLLKAGVNTTKPITVAMQHEAAFYGLAKAAGDATQAASDNAVGTYTDDAKAAIRTMLGAVGDVQINGTSVVSNGVANVPLHQWGLTWRSEGVKEGLAIDLATANHVKSGSDVWHPITSRLIGSAAFYGLAKASGDTTQSSSSNAVGTYTDNAKASIKSMLGIVDGSTGTVDITGATPTINAVENTRYVCGEVTSLSFTPPSSGISIVRFTSGSTVTVLTIPSTVKFPEWFDPTALETNTIYEICVTDGTFGAVMSWAL